MITPPNFLGNLLSIIMYLCALYHLLQIQKYSTIVCQLLEFVNKTTAKVIASTTKSKIEINEYSL